MEQDLQQLISDVETLSLILKIVIVLLVILILVGIGFIRGILQAQKLTLKAGMRRSFHNEAEELLRQESYARLAELSVNRINEAPGDAIGFYYLGRAQFGVGELAESKSNFKKAWELDPLSRDEIDKCLAAVEEELASKRPKPVQ